MGILVRVDATTLVNLARLERIDAIRTEDAPVAPGGAPEPGAARIDAHLADGSTVLLGQTRSWECAERWIDGFLAAVASRAHDVAVVDCREIGG